MLAAAMVLGWLSALATVALAAMYAHRLNSAQQLVRAQIERPAGFDFADVTFGAPMLSPDGLQIAFLALKDNKRSIFVQPLSSGKAQPLAGTENATFAFWSPDGKYLGLFSNGRLRKVSAAGGPVQAICDAPDGRGGDWNAHGTILFAPGLFGPLQRVSDGGGAPEDATPAHKGDKAYSDRIPYFLPDGRKFLFLQVGKDEVGSVYPESLDGGDLKQILPFGSNVAYTNGYVFYVKDRTLTGQAFDVSGLQFRGKPIPIVELIEIYGPRHLGNFPVSQSVLVYRQAPEENRELVWLDLMGKDLEHWGEPAPYIGGIFSPRSHLAVLGRANADGQGNSLWLTGVPRWYIKR